MDPEEIYKESIYDYCNKNQGEKILSTGFNVLWPLPDKDNPINRAYSITPKDLAVLTDKIIRELVNEKVLKKAKRPKDTYHPYEEYKILDNN